MLKATDLLLNDPTSDTPLSPGLVSGCGTIPRGIDSQDLEPSARLWDPSDEVWGLIAASKLTLEGNTIIPSQLDQGYLLKRRGKHDSDGFLISGVQVMYGGLGWTHGTLLKKIFTKYRWMMSLGVARNLVGGSSPLPWHVVVARRAQMGLTSLLRWNR